MSLSAELLFCSEFLTDCESLRIATENRLRSLGEEGLEESRCAVYAQQVDALRALEHQATLALQRVVRKDPMGPWIKSTVGIGEKQGARLLAALGDPCIRCEELDEDGNAIAPARPRRGPAELWAYCGFAPGQKRKKGVKSNWNAAAKMRAFLCAESCIKQMHSPYRDVYDSARANWADRDVKDGHKHNHALRLVSKAILKDMFLEARRLHGETA